MGKATHHLVMAFTSSEEIILLMVADSGTLDPVSVENESLTNVHFMVGLHGAKYRLICDFCPLVALKIQSDQSRVCLECFIQSLSSVVSDQVSPHVQSGQSPVSLECLRQQLSTVVSNQVVF